ncbi:MAG: hypothetical protein M3N68_06330 [Actinomycetota bacterium]|nr:hypothetical protein [Actinomycetota bacterium]
MKEDLTEEQRERIRLAHGRLRRASQECESLVATKPIRGRWEPAPVPPEVMETAWAELHGAYREVLRLHQELLGWSPPPLAEHQA